MAWSWKLLGLDEQDWVDASARLRVQGEEQVCGKDKEGMYCMDIAMGCLGEVPWEKVGPGSRCLSLGSLLTLWAYIGSFSTLTSGSPSLFNPKFSNSR